MGSLKGRLRRLEQRSAENMVVVPQPDGPPARFPETALRDAFLINVRRVTGEDVPEHPLSVAARRSQDPRWGGTFFADFDGPMEEVPDLSEGA